MTMGTSTNDDHVFRLRAVLGWLAFTTAAGVVNAGAVLGCDNFVTHVTGTVTNVALDGSLARVFCIVIGAFIAGAMFAVLMAETFRSRPPVALVLPVLVAFTLLIVIAIAGKADAFGDFGQHREDIRRTLPMLATLAAAMGLVNAAVASVTRNQIRITHFTGPVTDLAGNVVRAALGAGLGTRGELRWAALRLGKLLTFIGGAAFAVKLAPTMKFDVFAVAAIILMLALTLSGAASVNAQREDAEEDKLPDITKMSGPVRYEDAHPPFPVPNVQRRGDRD